MPLFDLSSFKTDNIWILIQNEKLYFFRYENPTDLMKESIGLRTKLYIIKTISRQEGKNVIVILESL